jgi:hypothetical protein
VALRASENPEAGETALGFSCPLTGRTEWATRWLHPFSFDPSQSLVQQSCDLIEGRPEEPDHTGGLVRADRRIDVRPPHWVTKSKELEGVNYRAIRGS